MTRSLTHRTRRCRYNGRHRSFQPRNQDLVHGGSCCRVTSGDRRRTTP
ncbi:hypothetical protein KTR9_2160 [Gordonia sp. KTR9]|nr:hypothetical protein KTR9_2160 [Gordonia sp. KTR9]